MKNAQLLVLLLFSALLVGETLANCSFQSRIHPTGINVPQPVQVNDIWPWTGNPTFLRPTKNGGAMLAWGNGKGKSFIRRLDSKFSQIGNDWTLPYEHCRDVIPLDDGGAIYLGVRDDPAIHDPPSKKAFCKDPVANPGGAWCARVDVVRLDANGNQRWSTQLNSNIRVGKPGSQFVWWYGNFMRLAYGGGVVAALWEAAGTNDAGEIHQGETGRYLNANDGRLLKNTFGFCGHSSDVRLAWNERSKKFGSFCLSDNTKVGFHFTITDTESRKDLTVWAKHPVNAAYGTMGGVVPEQEGTGWWTVASYPEQNAERAPANIQLSHINAEGVQDKVMSVATTPGLDEKRPFIAAYGPRKEFLLVGWSSGNKFLIEARSMKTGEVVHAREEVSNFALPIGRDWITLANGHVAFVWVKSDNTLQITRIGFCNSGTARTR